MTGFKAQPGFPIRKSLGIMTASVFPRLIAGNHVLHRLLAPRHSPRALSSLSNINVSPINCTYWRRQSCMIIITYPCKDFKEPWRNQLNDKPRQKSLQFRMVGLTGLEPVTPRLSSACSNQLSYKPYKNGGAEEIRTPDILLAKQALYQLS